MMARYDTTHLAYGLAEDLGLRTEDAEKSSRLSILAVGRITQGQLDLRIGQPPLGEEDIWREEIESEIALHDTLEDQDDARDYADYLDEIEWLRFGC